MTGMLHMKILFAERPHARVKWIDTGKAEAAPGVVAVYTAKDVPVNEYGLQFQINPSLRTRFKQTLYRHCPLCGRSGCGCGGADRSRSGSGCEIDRSGL